MLNPRARRGRAGRKLRHIHIKIRLSKSGDKPTHDEVLEAVDEIIATGDAPSGWTLEAQDWNPSNVGEVGIRNILQAWSDSLDIAVVQTEGSGVARYDTWSQPLTLWEMRDMIIGSGMLSRREERNLRYYGETRLRDLLALTEEVFVPDDYPDYDWEIEIVADVDT